MSRTVTLAAVLVAGVAAALVIVSIQRGAIRGDAILDGIVDPDAGVRTQAWSLKGPGLDRERVLERLLQHRDQTAILAEAAIEFDRLDWKADPTLVVAAARLGDPEPLIACLSSETLQDAEARGELLTGVAMILAHPSLQTPGLQIGDRVMEACLSGLPRDDHPVLMEAMIAEGASPPGSNRPLLALALLGTSPADDFRDTTATILARSIATGELPSDQGIRAMLPGWTLASPTMASIGGPELIRRVDKDDPEARRALGVLDHERFLGSAKAVLADRTSTFERRAIAATRLLEHGRPPGDASILNLLLAGPEDSDGSVHAAACIAWLGLSDSGRKNIEDRWWHSGNDAEVQAALLLAALRHHDGSLPSDDPVRLEIDRLARDPNASPRVRRTARLATRATQRWPFEVEDLDPEIYASRTRRFEDGRLDPDAILLGLIAEDPVADRLLVSQPASPTPDAATFAREIAWRRALTGIFRPIWIETIGEPVPGDEEALRLWMDMLAAARLATPFAEPGSSGEDLTR